MLSLGRAIAAGNLLFKYSEKPFIQEHYEEIIAIRPGKILNQYTPIVEADLTIKRVKKSELIDGMMSSSNIPKMIGKMTWAASGA
ncbi:hypothetical protein [uncultured Brevibacillus sp.]|uniref:hypothetical protein n=1 Tax=uncultured Brevibacillus sp. TaxID=169970 RepID=UPI002593796E|nr:hypothetical protein [uncultured Brevibacillus sp.]